VLSLDAPAHAFHQRLGFKEASLIAALGGSYRYGIKLDSCDNHSGGHSDDHYKESVFSYSPTGEMLNNVEFHHYLSRLKSMGREVDHTQYSLTAQASAQAKFTHPAADSALAKIEYNLQFDGQRYSAFLKKSALERGVNYVEHDVVAAEQSVSGAIIKLELSSGKSLAADFVFDSSGVIFDQVLGIQNESFSDTHPYNRCLSWMTPCSETTSPLSSVKGLAQSYLTRQQIQAGVAYALSYHDKELSDQQALKLAKQCSPNLIPEQSSYSSLDAQVRSDHWVANAVAIGTVAGNTGNLIFGSLFHTHTALARWLELYPTQDLNLHVSKQYNKTTNTEYLRVLDIHSLLLSTINSEITLPVTLRHRMQLFAATGNIAFYEEDVFDKHQWVNLLMACGIWPQRYDAMLAQQSERAIARSLASVEKSNQALIASMPSLDALLNAIRQAA
jgi:tryptophan halogenase